MAITVDWNNLIINILQADLTFVSGTSYSLDMEAKFRADMNALMASEEGIVFEDPIDHVTEKVLSGITYARFIEIINGYTVTFEDLQYGVNLSGANHNLADVVNRNQVSVLTQNSAGLIRTEVLDLDDAIESNMTFRQAMRVILATLVGKLSGAPAGPILIRDTNDTKDRVTATVDADGNRTAVTLDKS